MACFKSLTRLAVGVVGVRGSAGSDGEGDDGEVALGVEYLAVRLSSRGPRATALNLSSSCCGAPASGCTTTSFVDSPTALSASPAFAYTTK